MTVMVALSCRLVNNHGVQSFTLHIFFRLPETLKETPAKLVDMDTVQGVVAQKNEDITNS